MVQVLTEVIEFETVVHHADAVQTQIVRTEPQAAFAVHVGRMNHIGHSTQPINKAVAHLIVACKTASLRVDPQAPILILEGDEIDVELMVISLVDVAHIALDALVLRAEPQYTRSTYKS